MPQPVKIDFVSDIACPWCVVGLKSLEAAMARIGPDLEVELRFQPFELNPQLPAEGEDLDAHLRRKYGMSAEQMAQNRETLRARGDALGFEFRLDRRRMLNTFDAHRLLHWAVLQGGHRQSALKHVLLRAYFSDGLDVSSPAVLVALAAEAGLDADQAGRILVQDDYAQDVRVQQRHYQQQGITAVPSVIFNDRHLIQGGQPVEMFERTLRQLSGLTP